MSAYTTGRIDIRATALEPIHHGGGTSGNTQRLRLQPIVLPSGEQASVPFISGNSLKHMIRAHGAAHALDLMGVPDGALPKGVVDLLFSGGHLSKGGGVVRLDRARRLAELFPILSVCGYSAGNWMEASKIGCRNLHLVCRENAWRMPEDLEGHPHALVYAGALQDEEFGTRHEASRAPRAGRMLSMEADAALVERKASGSAEKGDSSQMIFDFQVIRAGASFWTEVHFRDLRPLELVALRAALSHACEGRRGEGFLFRVGAKASVGMGLMSWRLQGHIRVDVPLWEARDLRPESVLAELGAYGEHLRAHRDEILSILAEAVS